MLDGFVPITGGTATLSVLSIAMVLPVTASPASVFVSYLSVRSDERHEPEDLQ